MTDLEKIKLVIWDLDDTFWKGTLSEGPVEVIGQNVQLIKDLTDCGIVNTICSKNSYDEANAKLEELNVRDYFVFASINWEPKGKRIADQIAEMRLRPINCLFIDDNPVELNEARFYNPGIMAEDPSCAIPILRTYLKKKVSSDLSQARLNQYKILETKQKAKKESSDNVAFLYDSKIEVEIHNDCFEEIDRIVELVERTNQLNFTKVRSTRGEVMLLLKDKNVYSGYVTSKDKFGDYGIVGFFALKDNRCIHFLFSCRIIGQGVEQWVYANLGYPQLDVIGEVTARVTNEQMPSWINQKENGAVPAKADSLNAKIVFKGACDMSIMASYLSSSRIVEEYTYVGENGNRIEHHNHSVNYLTFPFLNQEQKNTLLEDCIFNDPEMFGTSMYDDDVAMIFLSTQIEPMLGIYKRKDSDLKIAFAEYVYPLTEKKYWPGYVSGEYPVYQNKFTISWLEDFSSKYQFMGRISPEMYLSQLDLLFEKIPKHTYVCLLLGSEMPYLANRQKGYIDRHLYYKEINDRIKQYAKNNNRLLLISFNDYLKGQNDFTDNINHYQRFIYYQAAKQANKYIKRVTGVKSKQKSGFGDWRNMYVRNYIIKHHHEPYLYGFLRYLYRKIKTLNVSF